MPTDRAEESASDDLEPEPDTQQNEPGPQHDGDEPAVDDEIEQPCRECMPYGWSEGAYTAGCEHGQWGRPDPRARPERDE